MPQQHKSAFHTGYFKQKNTLYHLRNMQLLELSKCRTKTYGLNTTLFKGVLLLNKLPNHSNEAKSIIHFKNKIRGNGQGNRVLVVSALKLSTFKKCTYVKKPFLKKICCNIYIYIYLTIIIISIIIFLFLKFISSSL